MSETADLENRINAALDRIAYRVDKISDVPPAEPAAEAQSDDTADSADIDRLKAALEDEKQVNAQLQARVDAIKSKQDDEIAQLKAQVETASGSDDRVRELESEVQKLKAVNDQLRDNTAKMRDAISEGIAEPHLINKAMLTELEALRATRAADKSELDAIITELKPLVEEGA